MFRDAVIGILAAVAKQERVRLSERTIAGLQRARAQGRIGGRPRAEDDVATMKTFRKLKASGLSVREHRGTHGDFSNYGSEVVAWCIAAYRTNRIVTTKEESNALVG